MQLGVGVAAGVGVADGVGVGVGVVVVPATLKQLPLLVTKFVIVDFDASQKLVELGPTEGFINEFAQAPELSTCSAPRL